MKRLLCVMTAVWGMVLAPAAFGALDIFIKLDGILGESTDAQHEDWIDVLSFSWGVSNALTVGGGVGGASSRPVFTPLSFVQSLDRSVPKMFEALVTTKHIEDLTLDLVRPGADPHRFFRMKFDDVLLSGLSMGGNTGGTVPEVSVKATYEKITMTYTPQDPKGRPGPDVTATWDVRTGRLGGDSAALMGLFEAGASFENGNLRLVPAVPEPSTYATMLTGLSLILLVGGRRLRRR